MKSYNIREKSEQQWRGYTSRNVYFSATKSHREQKLVPNDCYDNILQPCNKVYKQADFLVSQIFKKTLDIGEKSLANQKGIYQ